MKVKLLGARVLVRIEAPQEQRGLIHIPKSAQRKPQEGVVLAVGSDVGDIAVGDRVIFGKFSYQEIPELEGALVWAKDVEAILE